MEEIEVFGEVGKVEEFMEKFVVVDVFKVMKVEKEKEF